MFSRLLTGACFGGIALGLIGFILGFFGPMIFMPDSNQGPLLGIFITGPVGTVIGGVAGAIVAYRQRPRSAPSSAPRP